ncbi:hypothetical protein B0H17DRAFT_1100956 [Mycena rosella]|uniref:Secreted protein n=1 Tax=Mycena rosella TaxID=1033263 RepID=A0AAD7CMC8_MYCRO|nr:hypothetical protein B0H17DRAFT_1100956 [Mycena rosella]
MFLKFLVPLVRAVLASACRVHAPIWRMYCLSSMRASVQKMGPQSLHEIPPFNSLENDGRWHHCILHVELGWTRVKLLGTPVNPAICRHLPRTASTTKSPYLVTPKDGLPC